MSLLDLSVRELLDRLGSTDPTPGGGSAAALAGAAGAALAAMVCAMPKTRTGAPEERSRLDAALRLSSEAGQRLQRLVDEDSAAFDGVMAAYRLPKSSDEEKARRKQAIASAMARATEVPMSTAEACVVVLGAAAEAVAHGNPSATSDGRTAAALALAGVLGALENVRINLRPDDAATAGVLAKADALWEEARQKAAELGLPLGQEPPATAAGGVSC